MPNKSDTPERTRAGRLHRIHQGVYALLKPLDGPIHVSVPTTTGRRTRHGIHLHRIPAPEVNVKLGRWEVDFLWRSHHLVVETDFWAYHRGSVAFEDDHARDLDLRDDGYTVLRFTDKQLEGEPERVAADVARAIRL